MTKTYKSVRDIKALSHYLINKYGFKEAQHRCITYYGRALYI